MNQDHLSRLIGDRRLLESKIRGHIARKRLEKARPDPAAIEGHLSKAERNLRFVNDNLRMGYIDWCITGCYYAVYHACLALIARKGFLSKSHDATLCVLIKDYYNEGMTEDELRLVGSIYLDYPDLVFYVRSKDKRQQATYGTSYLFGREDAEKLRQRAAQFIGKAKRIAGIVR